VGTRGVLLLGGNTRAHLPERSLIVTSGGAAIVNYRWVGLFHEVYEVWA
jgi:hypothetical protein